MAQSASLNDGEMMVLASAINETRLKGEEKYLLIAAETANFRCDGTSTIDFDGCNGGMRAKEQSVEDVLGWVRDQFPSASPELLFDFRVKNQNSAKIERPLPLKAKQTIWGRGGFVGGDSLPKDSTSADYLITVSRVGFDSSKMEALAYVGAMSWESSRLSFGEYIYLRKEKESWKVAGRARMWDLPPK
jgi:hypothetical protein